MPDTFPDIIAPTGLTVDDIAFSLSTPMEAGYYQTRAKTTRKLKQFELVWDNNLTGNHWLLMLEFWRSVGNFDAFYWQYPLDPYGLPGFGGGIPLPGEETESGFDTEVAVGWYEGPYFLVRFVEPTLRQTYSAEFDRYSVQTTLRQV